MTEIERLQNEVKYLNARCNTYADMCVRLQADGDELRKVLEAVRESSVLFLNGRRLSEHAVPGEVMKQVEAVLESRTEAEVS